MLNLVSVSGLVLVILGGLSKGESLGSSTEKYRRCKANRVAAKKLKLNFVVSEVPYSGFRRMLSIKVLTKR
jgi:hypothetical protein